MANEKYTRNLFKLRFIGLLLLSLPGMLYASSSASKHDASKHWDFSVYLDGTRIGDHQFQVTDRDNYTEVTSRAQFDVKFLFFTAYSYRHENTEKWRNGCLLNIDAITDDNGTEYRVLGENQQDEFTVNNTPVSGDDCIRTFAYWDKGFMKADALLNSQTGEIVSIDSSYLGKDTITVNEKPVTADKYRLTGKDIQIELWYTSEGQWIGLESTTPDGNVISYQIHGETSQ